MASSPGAYKGVQINSGTDAQIAAQMAAIDKGGIVAPIKPVVPVNSIPADQLGKNTATYSTMFPQPTAHTGLAETATASRDAYIASQAATADALTTQQDQAKPEIQSLFQRLGLQATKKADLYESSGLNSDRKAIDQITSDMESTGRAFDKRIEVLQKTNPDGMLKSGLDQSVLDLTREKASTLADQAIVLNARTRNYDTAKSIIDTKADAETEDLKNTLTGLQFFYSENAQNLSDAKRTLLQQKIDAADKEYQTAKELRTNIGQVQLTAATNGAPVSVVRAIGQTGSIEDASIAAGSYLKAPKAAAGAGFNMYTDEDQRTVAQSGLGGASERTKQVFLNTPAEFRQAFIRNGSGTSQATPQNILNSLAEWEAYQKTRKSSTGDVDALVAALKAGG